jgi:hypothetical protein
MDLAGSRSLILGILNLHFLENKALFQLLLVNINVPNLYPILYLKFH